MLYDGFDEDDGDFYYGQKADEQRNKLSDAEKKELDYLGQVECICGSYRLSGFAGEPIRSHCWTCGIDKRKIGKK